MSIYPKLSLPERPAWRDAEHPSRSLPCSHQQIPKTGLKENLCVPCLAPKSCIEVGNEHTSACGVHGGPEPSLYGASRWHRLLFFWVLAGGCEELFSTSASTAHSAHPSEAKPGRAEGWCCSWCLGWGAAMQLDTLLLSQQKRGCTHSPLNSGVSWQTAPKLKYSSCYT